MDSPGSSFHSVQRQRHDSTLIDVSPPDDMPSSESPKPPPANVDATDNANASDDPITSDAEQRAFEELPDPDANDTSNNESVFDRVANALVDAPLDNISVALHSFINSVEKVRQAKGGWLSELAKGSDIMAEKASLSETVGRLQRQLDLAECEKLALVDSNKELLVVVNNLRSELQGSGGVIGELKSEVQCKQDTIDQLLSERSQINTAAWQATINPSPSVNNDSVVTCKELATKYNVSIKGHNPDLSRVMATSPLRGKAAGLAFTCQVPSPDYSFSSYNYLQGLCANGLPVSPGATAVSKCPDRRAAFNRAEDDDARRAPSSSGTKLAQNASAAKRMFMMKEKCFDETRVKGDQWYSRRVVERSGIQMHPNSSPSSSPTKNDNSRPRARNYPGASDAEYDCDAGEMNSNDVSQDAGDNDSDGGRSEFYERMMGEVEAILQSDSPRAKQAPTRSSGDAFLGDNAPGQATHAGLYDANNPPSPVDWKSTVPFTAAEPRRELTTREAPMIASPLGAVRPNAVVPAADDGAAELRPSSIRRFPGTRQSEMSFASTSYMQKFGLTL